MSEKRGVFPSDRHLFYLKPCSVSWLAARYKSRNLNLTAKTIELYKDVE